MPNELRYGKWKYVCFVLVDLISLVLANYLSLWLYLQNNEINYTFRMHFPVMLAMIIIDLIVTFVFSTLRRVLRWKKRREVYESFRHVIICLVFLSLYLFTTRSGSDFSRVIVLLSYGLDYVFLIVFRTGLRCIMTRLMNRKSTALLMTTDRFADEGIKELTELGYNVKYLYLMNNNKKEEINGIPVAKDVKETAAIICWEKIEKVYIYGLDHQMVPEYLINACNEMKIKLELVDFNYRVLEIKRIDHKDPKYGSLMFLEGERDIPFPIRRVYWITETDADMFRGSHAHKLNCQLLYCPYGKIDIILDDGKEKTTVTLDRPEKGLLLMPGLWREMVWRESGSILCVLASEYYDESEYIRNYDEFLAYSKKYRKEA